MRICAATERMGGLIDDLLKLSRVTRSDLKRVAVDLSALAEEILGNWRQTDPQRSLETRIEPGLTVEADANLLRIVLENLLSNAWKFTSRRLSTAHRVWPRCTREETDLLRAR